MDYIFKNLLLLLLLAAAKNVRSPAKSTGEIRSPDAFTDRISDGRNWNDISPLPTSKLPFYIFFFSLTGNVNSTWTIVCLFVFSFSEQILSCSWLFSWFGNVARVIESSFLANSTIFQKIKKFSSDFMSFKFELLFFSLSR